MSYKKFNIVKDFQSDQIQRSSRKIFTFHFARRNADFNLTLVMGTPNRFTFQIINSLIESWGYTWPALTVLFNKGDDWHGCLHVVHNLLLMPIKWASFNISHGTWEITCEWQYLMSFIPSIIIIKHYKQEKWTLKTSYLRLKVFKNHNKIAISCLLFYFLCYLQSSSTRGAKRYARVELHC